MNTSDHLLWLEAHYALGKLEVAQGFTLSDKERSKFLNEYIAERRK